MIRRTALLSALSMSLLLGACSKNDDTTIDASAEAEIDAQVDEAPATWTPMDYWPAVSPFVQGSYSGTCLRQPQVEMIDATIAVSADGKVTSNGLAIDLRHSPHISLQRTRDDTGRYRSTVSFSLRPETDGGLMLDSGASGNGIIQVSHDKHDLMCTRMAGVDKLAAQPLNQALSSLFDVKKQTLSCFETRNLVVQPARDIDITIDGSTIRIGDQTFDTRSASSESMSSDNAGEHVSMILFMPDAQLHLTYHGAGKLADVNIMRGESPLLCQQKD